MTLVPIAVAFYDNAFPAVLHLTDGDVNLHLQTFDTTLEFLNTGIPGTPGPPGPTGGGNSVKVDVGLASTWIVANPLGRIPIVDVYLSTGELVLADVTSTVLYITVTFPSPQQGFVVLF